MNITLKFSISGVEWYAKAFHAMDWDVLSAMPVRTSERGSAAAELLERAGLKVWLDANELTLGDSLSRKIDEGLARSKFGVVVSVSISSAKAGRHMSWRTRRQTDGRAKSHPSGLARH